MTTMTAEPGGVTGGVDTHLDVHVAAAVDHLGGVLAAESFPTTAAGYRRLLKWLRGFGPLHRVGVEGTGSYGSAPGPLPDAARRRGARGRLTQPSGPAPTRQDRRRRRDRRRPGRAVRRGHRHPQDP